MKLCFELIVNLIRNINRNRNILKTISSRGLSMNNIVRLGYRYPSLSLSFLHFLDTTLYLFPRVSGFDKANSFPFFHTRFERRTGIRCYAMSKMPLYIFHVSESLVLSRPFLSFQKNR